MSKKMLKRSLVLGALMAFVLTGSAWAASVENNANGAYAIAVGEGAKADENCGVAIGYKAEGAMSSTAVGNEAKAVSSASAYGTSSNASGSGSVAIGSSSSATGTGGIAIGMSSTSEGGIAVGEYSDANNSDSIAIGSQAKAGKDGDSSANAAISIGERAESSYHGDIAIGYLAKADSNANGYSATAVGREAEASGKCAVAYGKSAKALENRATAIGHNAVASGIGDLAIGAESATSDVVSVNSASIGGVEYNFAGGDANAKNAIVAASIGGVTTSSAFEASSSSPKTIYRQLQYVAAGQVSETSTDAVNGSQLYAAYQAIEATQTSTGAAISGINQRLDKTNAKINKVGAGAAALAALHPLEYDPDDKLTFSAGVGNYAGENAAALGAFYRPNEKFMVSLGGTMGNGENMVNLGLSIGLDKPNGLAKLSKRELIQKVNAVEAENDALEDRVAKLEALVAQLASK